jgi:hypothetical protein
MMISVRCAECQCVQQECINVDVQGCSLCTKDVCCCGNIHNSSRRRSTLKKPLTMAKIITTPEHEDCCASGSCENNNYSNEGLQPTNLTTRRTTTSASTSSSLSSSGLSQFLRYVKGLYAAALGIEILCIAAAEIGENTGLYLFGFNVVGIPIAYAMGYALAGFTTFAAILGRYNYASNNGKIDSCCSVLEQGEGSSFIPNLKTTFRNFVRGITKLPRLHKQPNLKYVLKSSVYILVTAESACILTAETVDLIFYQYSIFLAVPLALLAGAFTVVAPEAYRKIKQK